VSALDPLDPLAGLMLFALGLALGALLGRGGLL
jgi:hypothetical protein